VPFVVGPDGKLARLDIDAPSGYRGTGEGQGIAPAPGHPDVAKAQTEINALYEAKAIISRMKDLTSDFENREIWSEKGGAVETNYGQMTANIAKLRDMGVLQPGELANIERTLPKPSAMQSLAIPTKYTKGAWNELDRLLDEKVEKKRAQYKNWPLNYGGNRPPPPPGFTVPVR
jgi:hypothetical protein